jgi:hypothetical protein
MIAHPFLNRRPTVATLRHSGNSAHSSHLDQNPLSSKRISRSVLTRGPSGRAACHAAFITGLIIACLSMHTPAWAQPGQDNNPLSWDRQIRGLFQRYCYNCHRDEQTRGDINLAVDSDPRRILENRDKWELVAHVLESDDMPPPDTRRRPSEEERERMVQFLQELLVDLDCESVKDPGPPPLRRLNRTEYDLAILDLTGLDLQLAQDFPPDPTSFGFDNIGPALTFTPVQVQQYHEAARQVVREIIAVRETSPEIYERIFGESGMPGDVGQLVRQFTDRAVRRPATDDFVDRLLAIYQQSREAGEDQEAAMGHVVTAVLMSPQFLMRVEQIREEESEPYRVDDYDLASRLSFFLWSRPPDDELLSLAADGRLGEPDTLTEQTLRMLKDPRSVAFARNFFGQWLGLDGAASHEVDREIFPEFDEELRRWMVAEVEELFREIIQQDRPVLELIDADYTFVNQRLAEHYGLDAVEGVAMRRVPLSDRRRGGALTAAALLMVQSDPNRTNVPRRGNYIADRLLGAAPPPPPPDVPPLEESAEGREIPLRELLEKHRSSSACSSCHARIDPYGFSLENYDAIGRWRTHDAGQPIDNRESLPDGTELDGPVALKDLLLQSREVFLRQFARNLLIYALGRGLEGADQCVVDDLVVAATEQEYRLSAVVLTLVQSRPFLYRRNPDY